MGRTPGGGTAHRRVPLPEPRADCTGAVLAGGSSRRMGTPKEGVILWDGRPMIEHVLDALGAVCRRVVVVGSCAGYALDSRSDVVHVPDLQPGAGPLAAIQALLESGLDERYLVAACDQPLLTPALLQRLLSHGRGHQPRFLRSTDGTRLDPFPGYYPVAWLPAVREALTAGELSVRRLVARSEVEWVQVATEEARALRSANTPDDVRELCKRESDL